ncbi:MAG: hydrogenase nickel incorporation protein HypB [Candidatus Eremiobacteraeota bacterium]|nr:hydrogenase nickel incorporation protein HypB [Candidatus Eremiobacteraeota bacterium]
MSNTIVEIQDAILRKNDELAAELRRRFSDSQTFVLNLLSSPGSGKTTLLEETLRRAQQRLTVAALVGDQATENDSLRLARSGAPVRQISTGAECRLDAQMIDRALTAWEYARRDLLCIENVGNLICPAEYDLGEDLRAVLFSVTEGEDKPLKYPLAFNTAHVALITKTDLADAVGFDRAAAHANIRQVHPGIPIIELSARTGEGVADWITFLETRVEQKRNAVPA